MGLRSLSVLACALALGSATAVAAVPAPKVEIATFAALKTPLPLPYAATAGLTPAAVDALVAKAKAKARSENKLLLIDLGGDWCPDCRILAGTVELPALKRFVDDHYVTVFVDIGRHMEKNLQVPAAYGLPKLAGVPSLLIVDPKTNKLLDEGHVPALADARHMSPQALSDWLAQWPTR